MDWVEGSRVAWYSILLLKPKEFRAGKNGVRVELFSIPAVWDPVQAINRHKIQFGITQLKDHTQMSIEATLRGDPGSVFMVNSHRFYFVFVFFWVNFIQIFSDSFCSELKARIRSPELRS